MTDVNKGLFITFEGGEGCGKSTQIKKLYDLLIDHKFDVILTREPGGAEISEQIRNIILDKNNTAMTDTTEVLLYAAARAQHVEEIIKPALAEGKIVICDRFYDSSLAYQGHARGLGDIVPKVNEVALQGCLPDLTILLKADPSVGSARISNREQDRIELESNDFHKRVYEGFLKVEAENPDRVFGIDATLSIEEIGKIIADKVGELLNYEF